jgi:hypothetical protein
MERLCIEPKCLVKPQESDLSSYPDLPGLKSELIDLLLRRRQNLIDQITDERENVISEASRPHFTAAATSQSGGESDTAAEREKAIARIQQMQRKEIDQLIIAELIREQTVRDEAALRVKREARQRELAEATRQRQAAEAEKRRQKNEVLLLRIQEKDAALLELKKKQEEEVERNQKILAEKKAEKLRAMAAADQARQRKAEAQREALDRQAEEHKRLIEERQREQLAHELVMQQHRVERLNELRERNQRLREEQAVRFAASQQRMAHDMEQRRSNMEQRDVEAKVRFANILKNRDMLSAQMRARTEMQVQRNRQARVVLEERNAARIREIACRDTRDQERRDAIMAKVLDRMRRDREIQKEKQAHLEGLHEVAAARVAKAAEDDLQKRAESEQRVAEVRKQREDELTKRVMLQKMKDQIRDENAVRKQRQVEYRQKTKGDVSGERARKATEYVELQQQIAWKKQDAAAELEFKKAAVIQEFREMMKRGGQMDIDALARKFDIDVEMLRAKVAEGRRNRDADDDAEPPPRKAGDEADPE